MRDTNGKETRGGVVVVATHDQSRGAKMRVGGLTVVERSLKQIARAGYTPIVVLGDGTVELPDPLPAGVKVWQPTAECDATWPRVGADEVRTAATDLDAGLRVTDEPTRRRAEDAVFLDLLRGDLGVVARTVNKPISFRITRHVLCRLPVTPNQVTIGAALLGLLGCGFIAQGQYGWALAGFALAQAQSILDGCDGELARVRFQQSAFGEWLDTIVDDLMNLALVLAVGFGLGRSDGSEGNLALSTAAAGMLLFYNAVAYRELARQGLGGEVLKVRWWFAAGGDMKALAGRRRSALMDLLSVLFRRDGFVLLWLVFALLDQLPAVLWYAVALSTAYFLAALGQVFRPRRSRP